MVYSLYAAWWGHNNPRRDGLNYTQKQRQNKKNLYLLMALFLSIYTMVYSMNALHSAWWVTDNRRRGGLNYTQKQRQNNTVQSQKVVSA